VDRGPDGSGFDANDLRSKLSPVLGGALGRDYCAGMDLRRYFEQYDRVLGDQSRRYFLAELEGGEISPHELSDFGMSYSKLQNQYLIALAHAPYSGQDLEEAIEALRRSADERGLVLDEGLLRRAVVAAWRGNVLLTGPPGSGKSTLAELVAAALGDGRPLRATANALWFRRDVIKRQTSPLLGAGLSHPVGRSGRLLNRALSECSVAPVKGA